MLGGGRYQRNTNVFSKEYSCYEKTKTNDARAVSL